MLNIIDVEPELNMMPLQNFSQTEINLLLQIIAQARSAKGGTNIIGFERLQELSNYKTSAKKLF